MTFPEGEEWSFLGLNRHITESPAETLDINFREAATGRGIEEIPDLIMAGRALQLVGKVISIYETHNALKYHGVAEAPMNRRIITREDLVRFAPAMFATATHIELPENPEDIRGIVNWMTDSAIRHGHIEELNGGLNVKRGSYRYLVALMGMEAAYS